MKECTRNYTINGMKTILERRKKKMWLPYLSVWLSEIWYNIFTIGIILIYSAMVVKLLLIIYNTDNCIEAL